MVRIIDVQERETADGDSYNVLILQGKIEPVISQTSGRPYLTARETSIPCTFDLETAKQLVGTQLKGDIEKVEVDPYDFEVPDTGKVLTLTHTYRYNPDPATIEEVVG
ncbi:MAG: hypothetical protein R6U11_02425 [Bacteroidales bacterium]